RVVILTPDKDMTQCVREDGRIVCFDRRKREFIDADAVRAKFGVSPASIPDYLALVGDSADGYPGLQGWGAKSAAAVLARYEHLEAIPERASQWDVGVRGTLTLAQVLREGRAEAYLYRELAMLRLDAPVPGTLDDLHWRGVPRPAFEAMAAELGARHLFGRVPRWSHEG
ncbi:MAG: 5'-3' exonuclease, partial [Candidatus Limnocylindrales bacterium]